jgi:Fe-S oxidoreductase
MPLNCGLLICFLAVMAFSIDFLIVHPLTNNHFLKGVYYLIWIFALNCAGVLLFISLLITVYIRIIVRPRYMTIYRKDTITIILFSVLLISAAIGNALRVLLIGRPQYESWSFIGYYLAPVFGQTDPVHIEFLYGVVWFLFMGALVALILIVIGKRRAFSLFSPLHVILSVHDSEVCTFYVPVTEEKTSDTGFGWSDVSDFSEPLLRSTDACTGCGKCDEKCPAVIAELPLSPQALIKKLNHSLDTACSSRKRLFAESVSVEEIFSCYDCGLCAEVCPSGVNPLAVIIGLKRHFVLEKGEMPSHVSQLYRNIEYTSNMNGSCLPRRCSRVDGLPLVSESNDYEYLLYVGCNYSFDKNKQQTLKFIVKLFLSHGIRVAILGDEEVCCGDAVVRTGNSALFEQLAEKNLALFNKYGVKKMITLCAHGYNVFKNEYPRIASIKGAEMPEVVHYTEIIKKLITDGLVVYKRNVNKNIVFHDSCFLGRFNNFYKTHRFILDSIPGVHLLEMRRTGCTATCCGASGAVNIEKKRLAYKLGEFRAMEGYSSGAHVIAVACPFCLDSISEGVRDINQQGIIVLNIADILALSLEQD